MSNPAPTDGKKVLHDETQRGPLLAGTFSFLLQPDSEATIEAELVDQPVNLPQEQFEMLLLDSECEV